MLVFNPQLGLLLKEVISFQLNQLGLAGETIHRSLLRSVCSSSSLFLQSSLRCSSTWTCESVRKLRRILKQTQGSLQPRNRHFHLYRPPQSSLACQCTPSSAHSHNDPSYAFTDRAATSFTHHSNSTHSCSDHDQSCDARTHTNGISTFSSCIATI